MDTVNPNWTTSFPMDYLFEVSQEVRLVDTDKIFLCSLLDSIRLQSESTIKKGKLILYLMKASTIFWEKSTS